MLDRSSADAVLRAIDELDRCILTVRRALHREMRSPLLADTALRLVVCRVGEERAGLPLDCVETVVAACELSPLAGASRWVAGLINFHGAMLPVIDLGAALLQKARRLTLQDSIVVCRAAGRRIGILVQGVTPVRHGTIESLQEDVDDVARAAFVMGVALVDGESVSLLSVPQLLTETRLSTVPDGQA